MRKFISLLLAVVTILMCTSCMGQAKQKIELNEDQLHSAIAELAVYDCYYHNVAKFSEEDVEGFLWWKKDKKFWVEYTGRVKLGVDLSAVEISVKGKQVEVTIPQAEVLSCKVDSESLNKDSFIVEVGSAAIKAEDEIKAFDVAQRKMKEAAEKDKMLLRSAQQRVENLLKSYIESINKINGATEDDCYTIKCSYSDINENKASAEETTSDSAE